MNKHFLAGLMALSFGAGLCMPAAQASLLNLAVFRQVLGLVETQFYAPTDSQKLNTAALRGLLTELGDPYSHYLEPAEYKQLQSEQAGSFTGIGVELGMRNQELTVVSALEGSPAQKAGLQSGDVLRKIEGLDTLEIGFARASSLLLGEEGSQVNLSIYRPDERQYFDRQIVRRKIILPSLDSRLLEPGVAYIRIHTFLNEGLSQDLLAALKKLDTPTLKALVLDLRDNPGGLLSAAIQTGDLFLKQGVLVQVVDRQNQVTEYKAGPSMALADTIPIYILINQGSASSTEILAGSLQDQGRATLVGEPSFGKSLVQVILPLDNGAGLALSTSKYLTAKGRDIQEKGLTPDISMSFKNTEQVIPEVLRLIRSR